MLRWVLTTDRIGRKLIHISIELSEGDDFITVKEENLQEVLKNHGRKWACALADAEDSSAGRC